MFLYGARLYRTWSGSELGRPRRRYGYKYAETPEEKWIKESRIKKSQLRKAGVFARFI